MKTENLRAAAWLLSVFVAGLAFIAWGQGVRWDFSHLSSYKMFPLFGLLAYSLIWSMYMVGFLRRRFDIDARNLAAYYKILSLIVLAAILIHPGLLWWQLWRDGFGLPPNSYLEHYVAPSLKWAVLLGTTGWLIFIVYELRFKLRDKAWWKYMEYLGDAAMVALFVHSLKLGGELQSGWFRYVWLFYGAGLLVVLAQLYIGKIRPKYLSQN